MKTLDFIEGRHLPLDILMNPIFFGGARGAGKTTGAKKLFEAGYDAGAQCISIVPVGKWWSLRLAADGKSPGLKDVFIFGGTHADVPITPESGPIIARVLVQKRIHAIIDVSLMRKGERSRFLAAFLEEFWLLKKQEDEAYPVVLFVEEAHAVIPQRPQPDEARMLGAAEDIAREGRNHGIGLVLIDQRSAVVNKNVIALVEVVIAMRTPYHTDRDTYSKWFDEKGEGDASWVKELKGLQKGEAFICAPVLDIFQRAKIKFIRTFDATATVSIGTKSAKVGTLTPLDVSDLRESLGQVIEEAEKNNPSLLRKKIADLERQLKTGAVPAPKAPKAAEKVIEKKVLAKGIVTRVEAALSKAASTGHLLETLAASFLKAAGELQGKLNEVSATPPAAKFEFGVPGMKMTKTNGVVHVRMPGAPLSPAAPQVVPVRSGDGFKVGGKSRDMLRTLAAFPEKEMSRSQLAIWVGMSQSGTFNTYLSGLKTAGLVTYPNKATVRITHEGLATVAESTEPLPAQDELISNWIQKQTGKSRDMLTHLVSAWPNALSRGDLAKKVLMEESGTFNTYLSGLKTSGLVEYPDRGFVKASDLLQVENT